MASGAHLNLASFDKYGLSNSVKSDIVFHTNFSSQKIHLASGSNVSAKLTITSNNIGINNITPAYSLDITGDLYSSTSIKTPNLTTTSIFIGNSNNIFNNFSSTPSQLTSISYTYGNMGIGTANPNYLLDVNGSTNISSNLIVSGNTNIRGGVGLSNSLGVIGSTILGSNLTVSGNTNITGGVGLSNSLGVIGSTILGSNLIVSGNTNITGGVGLSNTLNVNGSTTLSSNLIVSGNTNITGGVGLSNSLGVIGSTILGSNLIVSGNTNITGGVSLSNSLNVIGSTTLSSYLIVSGTTTLSDNLVVSGNVGIGTTNPSANLHVMGNIYVDNWNSTIPSIILDNGDNYLTEISPQIQFSYNGGFILNHYIHTSHTVGVPSTNRIDFKVCDGTSYNSITTGVVNTLSITGEGKVGIGTTKPGLTLDTNGSNAILGKTVIGYNWTSYKDQFLTVSVPDTIASLHIVNNGDCPSILMTTWDGSIVNGQGLGSLAFHGLHWSGANCPVLYYRHACSISSTANGNWTATTGGANMYFRCKASGATVASDAPIIMTLTSANATISGNLGLNTTPSYLLHLATDSAAKPGAGGLWTVPSDIRLKTNISIADYTRCYEIMSNLDLKQYTWRDDIPELNSNCIRDRTALGWIADDVLLQFPKAVNSNETMYGLSNVLDLNAGQIYACMYGTIKQLMKENIDLKESNKKFESKIDFLYNYLNISN